MEKLCNEIRLQFYNYKNKLANSTPIKPFYSKYKQLLENDTRLLTQLNNYINRNIDKINIDLLYGLYDIYHNLDSKLNIKKIVNILDKQKVLLEKKTIETYSFEDEMKLIEKSTKNLMDYNSTEKNLNPEIQSMIKIVEKFIKKKELICYGGQAINNILPKKKRFYTDSDLPDYDFFSHNAKNDAIELANIFYKNNYSYIETKEAIHDNTYKVFVNFEPIADITMVPKYLFYRMKKTAEIVNGIHYVSANILRMGIYIELSRPRGDISRWNKLYQRLDLLNTYKPIQKCSFKIQIFPKLQTHIEYILKYLENKEIVLFGPQCFNIYNSIGHYTSVNSENSRFYLLSNDYKTHCNDIVSILNTIDNKFFIKKKHCPIFERVPSHYKISYKNIPIIFIFNTDECYSYHIWNNIKIATIETILRFYFAFILVNREYLDSGDLICMANELIQLQKLNYNSNIDIFNKFTTKCIGSNITKADIFKKRWNSPKKRFLYRPGYYHTKKNKIIK